MLQMPLVVHTENIDRQAVTGEARTMVVNAHGGLMKLKMELKVGQPIVVVNPANHEQQSSRVVRVDDTDPEFFAVAFEFDSPAPKFWPVVFPPPDWV